MSVIEFEKNISELKERLLEQEELLNAVNDESYEELLLEIEGRKSNIKKEKEILNSLLEEKFTYLVNKYPKVWTINCTPSSPNRVEHNVGLFTTRQSAERYIPAEGRSGNKEKCIWYYIPMCVENTIDRTRGCELDSDFRKYISFPY